MIDIEISSTLIGNVLKKKKTKNRQATTFRDRFYSDRQRGDVLKINEFLKNQQLKWTQK